MAKDRRKLTNFEQRTLGLLKNVPSGKVITYAKLAEWVGAPKAARAIGNALHKNPDAPKIPCHRVVKSDGTLGGYAGGHQRKIALLKKEGIKIEKGKVVDFKKDAIF